MGRISIPDQDPDDYVAMKRSHLFWLATFLALNGIFGVLRLCGVLGSGSLVG